MSKRWYVASTEPQREATAQSWLNRVGFTTFLPRIMERVVDVKGRVYSRNSLMFPSYLFLCFDDRSDSWQQAYRQPGISHLLPTSQAPQPLPDGVVDAIRSQPALSDGCYLGRGVGADGRPLFHPHQEIRITGGVYEGFQALFDDMAGDRVVALMKGFTGYIKVTLPASMVVAAS